MQPEAAEPTPMSDTTPPSPLRIVPIGKKGNKSPIKASVGIHDRSQVEVIFAYFPTLSQTPRDQATSYQVDAYLFMPSAMGITESSYPKDRFYSDLRPLLRLREPKLSYKELKGADDSDERSPINFLRRYFDGVRAGTITTPPELAIDEIHLFSCSYLSYCYRKMKRITGKLKKQYRVPSAEQSLLEIKHQVEECVNLVRKSHRILLEWRKLRVVAAGLPQDLLTTVKSEMSLADEYCSYAFRDCLALMLMQLPDLSEHLSFEEIKSLQRRMKMFLRFERLYSFRHRYMWIEPEGSQESMEAYVTRRSALKKHMQQVLYLDVRSRPLFAFQQQLGGMLAAGVAALWAVMADLVWRSKAGWVGGPSSLGTSGFVFITGLIIAYVLKDRIKELGRSYFSGKFLMRLPDNSSNIEYHSRSGADIDIGTVHEYTRFLSSGRVSNAVRRLRSRLVEVENPGGNTVIHYRKRISLNPTALGKLLHPVRAVHDILRLNIQSFLIRLDDVLHEEFAFRPSGEVVSVMMPKVYYLDLILRYSWGQNDRLPRERSFEFIRLVLNKNGLARVDRLIDACDEKQVEGS